MITSSLTRSDGTAKQREIHKAKRRHSPALAGILPHRPAGIQQAASDETAILVGTRKEKACAPQLNSGMFASMKEMGDILGVFVGHDHDDDYAVFWKGILLAYGRYTGGDTVYNNLSNGARVIEMTEGQPISEPGFA